MYDDTESCLHHNIWYPVSHTSQCIVHCIGGDGCEAMTVCGRGGVMSVICDGLQASTHAIASELAVPVDATKCSYHMSKANIYCADTNSAARCKISVHGDGHATFILRLTDIFSARAFDGFESL